MAFVEYVNNTVSDTYTETCVCVRIFTRGYISRSFFRSFLSFPLYHRYYYFPSFVAENNRPYVANLCGEHISYRTMSKVSVLNRGDCRFP